MEWSESINRYFPHMAGCPYIVHCPLPIQCIVYCVCIAQNLPVPKIHIACYPSFKGYCPLPIEYCQLPIASRQWLVSNCVPKIRSPSQQQEWISFSRFGCASRPPAAGRDRKLLRVRPHLTQARLIFYLNFLGFFFTFSLRHTMCIYQPRVCEGRKLIRE